MLRLKHILNIEVKTLNASIPFLLVTAEDNIKYQVKIPNPNSSAMLKEYIAFTMANKIDILTPSGDFLYFPIDNILPMLKQAEEYSISCSRELELSLDMLKNKDGHIILFGIEWLEDKEIVVYNDIYSYFDKCISNNIYASFSFDLLLYNHDRHQKNILICSVGQDKYKTYLIDHDRIFNTYKGIEEFKRIKMSFDCLRDNSTEYLYQYIDTPAKKDKILEFSIRYKSINISDISDILNLFSQFCPPDILSCEDTKQSIIDFIYSRIENIEKVCKENLLKEFCYT